MIAVELQRVSIVHAILKHEDDAVPFMHSINVQEPEFGRSALMMASMAWCAPRGELEEVPKIVKALVSARADTTLTTTAVGRFATSKGASEAQTAFHLAHAIPLPGKSWSAEQLKVQAAVTKLLSPPASTVVG